MNDFIPKEINTTKVNEPIRYVAKTDVGWGVPMLGIDPDDDSDLDHTGVIGKSIINFKIDGTLVKKARVRNKRGKWLPYGSGFDTELGNDTEITGIEVVGKGLIIAVHIKGGQWLNPLFTSDIDGDGAIVTSVPIDGVWIDEV